MNDPSFELLEHPADIGFRVRGATREELFASAAFALLSVCGEPAAAQPLLEYPLAVESGDLQALMVDWLSEVLYYYDARRVAFRRFRVARVSDTQVQAVGLGEPRDPERHRDLLIVKAVTYHQLRVEREAGGGWVAEVYVDI
jgi:SHS2 domain-containing protein